jgi:sulfur carrier protein
MTIITLNGTRTRLPATIKTLSDMYTHLTLSSQGRVIELNQEIIQEKDLANTTIKAEDSIEIIQFMGGGESLAKNPHAI